MHDGGVNMRTIEQLTYTNPDSEKVVSNFMKHCGGTLEEFSILLRKLGYNIPYEIRLLSGTSTHQVVALYNGHMNAMFTFYDDPGEETKISIYYGGSTIDYYIKVLNSGRCDVLFEARLKR